MRRPTTRWCPQVPGDVALVFAVGLADLAAAQTKPEGLRGHGPFCKTTPREHMTGPRCFFACDPDESSIKPFLDVMGATVDPDALKRYRVSMGEAATV